MTVTYIYNDANGNYLGTVVRNVDANGRKIFRASAGFPNPRPLYGLARLAQRPAAAVLVCEGEKTADAAGKIFPVYVCVTSPFGALSAAKADWSPLAGRDVTIWPDHDTAGMRYAADVAGLVPQAKVVPVPWSWPDGWDLADDLPGNITQETLASLLLLAEAPEAPKVKKKKPSKADLRRTAEEAKAEREALMGKIKALRNKTMENGCTPEEAASAAAKAAELMAEYDLTDEDVEFNDIDEEDDFGTESALRESAKDTIAAKDVLAHFGAAWRMMMAGEENNAKLLYLVATSRLFSKPMHAAIKGTSAAGKSEVRKCVLRFIPSESVLSFTTLSERALLYFKRDFCHMILSMGEASGSEEQELQDYLLRELMSEGRLRYPVAVKGSHGAMETEIIEKNGPVSFLVTTTKNLLHQENETRMISIEVDDSSVQTAAVLLKVAELEGLNLKLGDECFIQWQNFQRWLAKGNCNVTVPFARALAALIPPRAVRLRRDFTQVLMAIKAHALIHREHRFENDAGEITADITHDYKVVRELMSDLLAEGAEIKVKATVRETVDAVAKLQPFNSLVGVSAQTVGKELKLDKSAAWRRLKSAMATGLIVNVETRKFQPGLYRTSDSEQDTQELLPSLDALLNEWCRDAEAA